MTIIHCLTERWKWQTYCGRSLEHLQKRWLRGSLKSSFGYHQSVDGFLDRLMNPPDEKERRCVTCLRAVRAEKKRKLMAAVRHAEKRFPRWTKLNSKKPG